MALRDTSGEPGFGQSAPPLEAGGDVLVVPDAQLLFTADYSRLGDDLLLTGADGARQVVAGYFASESPPVLASPGGAVMTPEVVAQLAGPRAPGQYAQAGPAEGPVAIGQVETATGSVEVIRAGRPIQLEPGDAVYQNDVVQTGLASELVIGFADGTIFSLGANARLILDGMVYDPAGSSNSLSLSLVHGVFSFVTGQIAPTGGIEITTPVATLGIRGTTVHGVLETIAGPLTVFLGRVQLGTAARIVLADPLTRVPFASLDDLGLAFILSGVGARPVVRALTAFEQEFSLQRSEVIHGVQSTFDFRYDTGEPIVQPGETLRTQVGPNLPSGGIGFDREAEAGELLGDGLLRGLEGSPTLALLDGSSSTRPALGSAARIFTSTSTSTSAATRVELAEADATTGGGTTSSGQIVPPGGTTPIQSLALVGVTFVAGGVPLSLTSGGLPVAVVQSDTQAQGFAGGVPVFLFTLNPDGSFTFSLFRPIDHPIAGATGTSDTIDFGFDIVVTFTDGTTLQTSVLSVVLDSGPEATSETGAVSEADGLGIPVTGNLPILGGGDGVKSVELIGQSAALSAGGQPVSLVRDSGDTFLGLTADGTEIFRMTFDAATGDFAFTLLQAIDHGLPGADSVDLVFRVEVIDGDNDSVISTITITALDDVPVARDDTDALDAGAIETGNVLSGEGTLSGLAGADVAGADGAQVTGVAAGAPTGAVSGGVGAVLETALGFLTLSAGGGYVYTAKANVSGTDTFGYTITDGDGDSATATLSLAVGTSAPTVAPATAQVAEAGLDAGDVAPGDDLGSDPGSPSEATGPLNLVFSDPDGPARVIAAAFGAASVAVPADNSEVSLAGTFGTLTIRADGTYAYALADNADHGAGPVFEIFGFTVSDALGNTSSSTIAVEILDDAVTVGANAPVSVQESALAEGSGGGGTVASGTLSFVAGADGARIVALALGGQAGVVDGDDLVISGPFFEFRVDTLSGAYDYTLTDNTLAHAAGEPLVQSFAYTVRDGDGDTAAGLLEVRVDDDVPSILDGAAGGIRLVHDESPGQQNGVAATLTEDNNDDDVSAAALEDQVRDAEAAVDALLGADGTNLTAIGGVRDTLVEGVDFDPGADGLKEIRFDLSAGGIETGDSTNLRRSSDDGPITYVVAGAGLILGVVGFDSGDDFGDVVFSLHLETTSTVPGNGAAAFTFVQYQAIEHFLPGDGTGNSHDEDLFAPGGQGPGALLLSYVVEDNDGDTATASGALGIRVNIEDDGPSIALGSQNLTIINDETPGVDADSDDINPATALPAEIAAAAVGLDPINVSRKPVSFKYGADGKGATGGIALDPVADGGADSGLVDALTGAPILLFNGADGAVVGRVGGAGGAIAFVSFLDPSDAPPTGLDNASSADLWFVQYRLIDHDDPFDPDGAGLAGGTGPITVLDSLAPTPELDIRGQGLSLAVGGTGLENPTQSGTITVDIGGVVVSATLYWVGRDFPNSSGVVSTPPNGPDDELIFAGNAITADRITGSEIVNSGSAGVVNNIGYAADVTDIVAGAGTGAVSFSVADGDTADLGRLNGASLLVTYTDPTDTTIYRVIAFDGLDFAFAGATPAPDAGQTEPVTFRFDAAGIARDAEVALFVGDASPERSDRIEIDGTSILNQLDGSDGVSFDADVFDITIAAGSTETTVQLFSEGTAPDSLLWAVAALRTPISAPADEFLTLGYTVTDADGDAAAGTATVTIVADLPTANVDTLLPTSDGIRAFATAFGADNLLADDVPADSIDVFDYTIRDGDDIFNGGPGPDTFVFSLSGNAGAYTIADFSGLGGDGDVLSFTDVVDVDRDTDVDIDDVVASFSKAGSTANVTLHSGTTIAIEDVNSVLNTLNDLDDHSLINGV